MVKFETKFEYDGSRIVWHFILSDEKQKFRKIWGKVGYARVGVGGHFCKVGKFWFENEKISC